MYDDDALDDLRIARLKHSPGQGWLLRFAWTADPDVFAAGRNAIKDLPTSDRRWHAQDKVWWISDNGMYWLRQSVPVLEAFIRQHTGQGQRQERPPRNTPPVRSPMPSRPCI